MGDGRESTEDPSTFVLVSPDYTTLRTQYQNQQATSVQTITDLISFTCTHLCPRESSFMQLHYRQRGDWPPPQRQTCPPLWWSLSCHPFKLTAHPVTPAAKFFSFSKTLSFQDCYTPTRPGVEIALRSWLLLFFWILLICLRFLSYSWIK